MPNAIAFFPWIRTDREQVIGAIRLLPYERGKLPGDRPNVSQATLDGVLAAYATRKDTPVSQATLLELVDWRLGDDPNGRTDDLFRARDLSAFSALARRRLFRGHMDYCNAHCYQLVIQSYDPANPGTFSFTTRRRDGGTQTLWGSDDFAFYRPLHVDANARLKIDEQLMMALQAADERDRLPHDAIVEFSAANTDSSDVPLHTEVVMTKSAFERLFEIGPNVEDFVDALNNLVPKPAAEIEPLGPLTKKWFEARPKATRLIDAWAREFCDLRGGAAHGKERGGKRFLWSPEAHLAFASILFPLVVKQQLAKEGFLQLDERNAIELEWIEAYVMYNPFEPRTSTSKEPHPWEFVRSDVIRGEQFRRHMARELAHLDSQ